MTIKSNRTIKFALILTKGMLFLILVFFVLFLLVVVHWHIDPASYQNVDVSSGFEAGFGIKRIKVNLTGIQQAGIWLSDLSYGMMYWLLFRNILFFTITILIVLRIIRILSSIQAIHTFYDENIRHFKRLGLLGLGCFILSCFNFYYMEGKFNMSFTLAFAPLLFSVGNYVMAEIFTEGKSLQEDKDQII